jgi:hypothetical protein
MKKQWQKKESKDAEEFGGRVTPRSGGMWSFPGDVKTDDFLIDAKTTDKKSYSLTVETWRKLYSQALKSQRLPLLSIQLVKENVEVVVLDKNDFIAILEDWKK